MAKTLKEVLAQATPGPWIVDECEDAYGNDTIRKADGSPNGGIEGDPIATVYDPGAADLIVHMQNTYAELVDAMERLFDDWKTLVGEDLRDENADVLNIWNEVELALARAKIVATAKNQS
jgi:hypothetical protein